MKKTILRPALATILLASLLAISHPLNYQCKKKRQNQYAEQITVIMALPI